MNFFSLITGSFRKYEPAKRVFIETEPYENGFSQHYEKNIKPHIDSFEAHRIKSLEEASVRIKVCIPLGILFSIAAFYILKLCEHNSFSFKLTIGVYLLSISALFFLVYSSIQEYGEKIKSVIFPNIISFLGQYQYFPEKKERIAAIIDSGIVPKHDREISEDEISGFYKDVKIDFFETNLKIKHRNKNNVSHYSSIFKGAVINLSMNKNFNSKTIVRKDFGKIGNFLSSKPKLKNFEKVSLEDPRFEKEFEVYSQDQIEARYLLTTSFMERLLNLVEAFDGKSIECSFYDNKLTIMVAIKKNLFEPGSIYESEDFADDSKTLLKELNMIFCVIDILKLDQNIGM